MNTNTAPPPARVAHKAIADAIELLTQSAQDLTECLSTADGPDWENNPGTKAAHDKDLATAAALRTVQAEIEAPLLKRIEALEGSVKAANAEAEKYKEGCLRMGSMWEQFVFAVQAAVIEEEIGSGLAGGMVWIQNTLSGPDLLPNMAEAQAAGGAQKWFDARIAEEEARVAAFKLPPHPDTVRLDMLVSSGLQVHESCGNFRLREVMDGHAIGKVHPTARAAIDAGLADSAEPLPILRLLAEDTEGGGL